MRFALSLLVLFVASAFASAAPPSKDDFRSVGKVFVASTNTVEDRLDRIEKTLEELAKSRTTSASEKSNTIKVARYYKMPDGTTKEVIEEESVVTPGPDSFRSRPATSFSPFMGGGSCGPGGCSSGPPQFAGGQSPFMGSQPRPFMGGGGFSPFSGGGGFAPSMGGGGSCGPGG